MKLTRTWPSLRKWCKTSIGADSKINCLEIPHNQDEDTIMETDMEKGFSDSGTTAQNIFFFLAENGTSNNKQITWTIRNNRTTNITSAIQSDNGTLQYTALCIPPGGRPQRFGKNWEKMTKNSALMAKIGDTRGKPDSICDSSGSMETTIFTNNRRSPERRRSSSPQIHKGGCDRTISFPGQTLPPNFFTIREPYKARPILDCSKLNEFIQCARFKMERIPALKDISKAGD